MIKKATLFYLCLLFVSFSFVKADELDDEINRLDGNIDSIESQGPTPEELDNLFGDEADERPQYKLVKPGKCPHKPGSMNGTENLDLELLQGPWMKMFDEAALAKNYSCMSSYFAPRGEKRMG